MVPRSSKLSLVAASLAALAAEKAVVSGFVQPRGTSVSPVSQPPLQMSISLPDGDSSNPWDGPQQSSSSRASDGSAMPDTSKGAADGLESLETASSIADVHERYAVEGYAGRDGAEPLREREVPEPRRLRWEREALVQSKYATGDEVFELRASAASLREQAADLRANLANGNFGIGMDERTSERHVAQMERDLLNLNGRDAEFMYAVSLELMEQAWESGDEEDAERYRIQAKEARLCIPQLNMHGLWVGKYGEHGYEMINITYSGDVLVATKVTGDRNVPKGEVSFTADLSPQSKMDSLSPISPLEPIELNPKAAQQWGKRYLPRHLGKGQVASEGFANAQWMEGQLILVGRFFSFAWVPIGHQVFFGRPSGELTLKMLRDAKGEELKKDRLAVTREAVEGMWEELKKDRLAVTREAVEGMWEETYWAERDVGGGNYYEEEDGCFQ